MRVSMGRRSLRVLTMLALSVAAVAVLAQPRPQPQQNDLGGDVIIEVEGETDPEEEDLEVPMIYWGKELGDLTMSSSEPPQEGSDECDAITKVSPNVSCMPSWEWKSAVTGPVVAPEGNRYGRGFGYSSSTTCSKKESVGCEQCGLLWVPKCHGGFQAESCAICARIDPKPIEAPWPVGPRGSSYGRGAGHAGDSYGRGAGFPWKFGDPLDLSKAKKRCEKKHGRGGCEKKGEIYYPRCKKGYEASGCCLCVAKAKATCEQKEKGKCEKCGLLYYPKCDDGYSPLGCNLCRYTR